jgi:hypothetical protein
MEKRIDNLEFLQSAVRSVGKESMRESGDFCLYFAPWESLNKFPLSASRGFVQGFP